MRRRLGQQALSSGLLGFANRTLAYQLPESGREGAELRRRLQQLGILRESGSRSAPSSPRAAARRPHRRRPWPMVGEKTNKLVGYWPRCRGTSTPLAVIVQSSTAAGKSALMEAVLAFVPEESRVQYSAMIGQSLFYMGATDLQHKVLAIVEEAGAESGRHKRSPRAARQ